MQDVSASAPSSGNGHITAADLGLGDALVATAGDAPATHVRARLDAQLRALLAHQDGTRSGADPEDLHQMRVAVRRSRAALKADTGFGAAAAQLQTELRWLGNALGPVRDLDVQLARLRADAAGFEPVERAAVETLLTGLVAERERARKRMRSALRSRRYVALLEALAAAVHSEPAPADDGAGAASAKRAPAAIDVVRAPYRKLHKAVTALDDQPADDDLHALRIRGKRLRYAAELAAGSAG
jgi:CHAD domain-containing protein